MTATSLPVLLASVTVTFNPSISELEAQLRALPAATLKVIVDNGSEASRWAKIESLATTFPNIHLIRSNTNLGLAAATNLGAQWLSSLDSPPEFLILLDQDSEPQSGSIATLISAFQHLQAAGHRVGCIGPLLMDLNTGLTHGFHQLMPFRWTRSYPLAGSHTPIQCASLNGSGTLVRLSLFQQLGGLDETFFIDHVDTEWAFRVMAHGHELWGIPAAVFNHSMGQTSMRFWLFGWRVWPVRSPHRHYYLYRNAITLMRRPYVPRVWKLWATAKLLLTASVMLIFGPSRIDQVSSMWKGIKTGLTTNAN